MQRPTKKIIEDDENSEEEWESEKELNQENLKNAMQKQKTEFKNSDRMVNIVYNMILKNVLLFKIYNIAFMQGLERTTRAQARRRVQLTDTTNENQIFIGKNHIAFFYNLELRALVDGHFN